MQNLAQAHLHEGKLDEWLRGGTSPHVLKGHIGALLLLSVLYRACHQGSKEQLHHVRALLDHNEGLLERSPSQWPVAHAVLQLASDDVTQLESIDSTTLVSASHDGTRRFWDVESGTKNEQDAPGTRGEALEGDRLAFSKPSSTLEEPSRELPTGLGIDPRDLSAYEHFLQVSRRILHHHYVAFVLPTQPGRARPNPIWAPKDRSGTHLCGVAICPGAMQGIAILPFGITGCQVTSLARQMSETERGFR
jgi:hypothetical protein